MTKRYDNGFTLIAIVSVTFAVAEWGSQGVKFGLSLLFVAFISFLCGEKWARGPRAINAPPRLRHLRAVREWLLDQWLDADLEKRFGIVALPILVALVVWLLLG